MKILLAEDNRFYRRLLETNLRQWGHEPVSCDDGEQAWQRLKMPTGPKIAVLDWEMPRMDGVEVCRKLRSSKDHHYVYVILLTAKSSKEDLVEGLDSGADDYVVKPFNPFELQVRLRAAVRIVGLQDDLLAALRQAESRAKQDDLTRLLNRSAILEVMEKELERSKRERNPLGAIMADVDDFKQINDSYGHVTGDGILNRVAARIKQSLRVYDSVGRYGGDEFLVILPNCGKEQTLRLAERVRRGVSAEPFPISGLPVVCTISLGVTAFPGVGTAEPPLLLRAADKALYEAKNGGRNRTAAQSIIALNPAEAHIV